MRMLLAAPRTSRLVLGVLAVLLQSCESTVARLAGRERAAAVRALSAAVAGGVTGPIDDFRVCARGAAIPLAGLAAEVHVWHGLRDRLVPPDVAWALAAAVPRCRVWVDPAESHFFFRRRSAEIASELAAVARAVPATRSSRVRVN